MHLGSTIALLMALAKSSIQFSPKEKSVLITGKYGQKFHTSTLFFERDQSQVL